MSELKKIVLADASEEFRRMLADMMETVKYSVFHPPEKTPLFLKLFDDIIVFLPLLCYNVPQLEMRKFSPFFASKYYDQG